MKLSYAKLGEIGVMPTTDVVTIGLVLTGACLNGWVRANLGPGGRAVELANHTD